MHAKSGESESSSTTPEQAADAKRVWVYPLSTLFAWFVVLVLTLYFFTALSSVLLGVLAAAIVAVTLNPLLKFVPARRGLAAAILGLSLIAAVAALIVALSWPLAGPIKKELADWPANRERINALLADWSARAGTAEVVTVEGMMSAVGVFFAGDSGQRIFSRGADVVFGILIWLVFIFIGSIFMLADPKDSLLGPAMRLVAPKHRPKVQAMLKDLGKRLRRWVLATLTSMTIVFTASLIGYSFIGLEFALPLALLAGLAEIVPTVGPACACVIAMLFAATVSGAAALGVLSVYAVIQALEAYVILPMIMKGAVHIHPAVTLFSVVLWGKLFGVPGLMLAIPINLTIASIAEHLYVRPRELADVGR